MKKRSSMNRRALLLFTIFSLLFFILTYRFSAIQITGEAKGRELKAYAEKIYAKEQILEASRGSILDRKGEPIAIDTVSYRLIAILDPSVTPENAKTPNHVVDPEKTAEVLSQYINMDKSQIYEQLTKDSFQVEFGQAGKNISNELKKEIESLKLPGIEFIRESKRSYPNGLFASHLIGFAAYSDQKKENQLIGQMGLEKSLNDYLTGQHGKVHFKSDLWGYILPTGNTVVQEPKDGNNVYLTIDKKIQTFLEEAMNEVQEEYNPQEMMGVVADAKTGAILAMSQRPTFEPNSREGIEQTWQNIVVETAFEPGSTFKFVPIAAALEEGVFTPNQVYQSGVFEVEGAPPIRDHNKSGWGEITYLEGIQRSSNVAVVNLVEKMGTDTFRNYLDKFKFGQPTGIGLDNEAQGVIQYQWERDKYATAYGQGTSVTVLQMIQAMTAITNEGKMMKPYLVEKIVDANGKLIKENKAEQVGTPISPETAKEVLKILESTTTSEHGTGKRFAIDGYPVAGKTGTAQIYESGKGYLTGWNNYLFSFIGAAPADDPELIVYVLVKQPKLNQETYEGGSVPVSKIFNSVMKNSLQYLNVEPSAEIEKADVHKLQDLTSKNTNKVVQELKKMKLEPVVLGKGKKIINTVPSANTPLIEGEKIILVTDGKLTMPDLTGWSLADVMKLVNAVNLKFAFEGQGFVRSQNIEPGTVISKESNLQVELQRPIETIKSTEEKSKDSEELE